MNRRVISVFLLFIVLISSIEYKLFITSTKKSVYTSKQNSQKNDEIISYRGQIYDRYGRKLVYNQNEYCLLIKPNKNELSKFKNNDEYEAVKDNMINGKITKLYSTSKPTIQDNDNIKTIELKTRYSNDFLCHIIGYTDYENNGTYGIEYYCNDILKNCKSKISVIYETDAFGRMLLGNDTEIRIENETDKSGVITSIDKDIQEITEKVMKNSDIEKGTAVVLDAENCEILACVSLPTFNLNNIEESINSNNSPFINRAFSQFSVGSVFKVITATAYLERNNNTDDFTYNCNGKITKSNTTFNCSIKKGHNSVNLTEALSKSCNTYFIELSNKAGAENLYKAAKNFGFCEKYDLGMNYTVQAGKLPKTDTLNSEAAVGNLGFGQGELTASPLQIAVTYNVFANNGVFKYPQLIKATVDADGNKTEITKKSDKKIINEENAKTINKALREAVISGTGINADSKLTEICGKTATAETGKTDENGNPIYNTWFCGFFPYENPKYVICIMKENGTSGSIDDAPLFKLIAEEIIKLNR